MNGTVGSNLKYQFLVVGLLLYTEVLYLILHITYRSINRIDRNYVHIGAIFAVFVSRNILRYDLLGKAVQAAGVDVMPFDMQPSQLAVNFNGMRSTCP